VPIRRCLAVGLLMTLIAAVTAQEAKPVKLEWKFEKDKTFYQTMTIETAQTLKFSGKEVSKKDKQTFFISWTPTKQEDKNWVFKLKIEGVQLDLDVAGNKVAYDSTRDDNPTGELSAFYKGLLGSELTVTLDPEMHATNVEGREKIVEALEKADPQLKTLVDQLLTRDTLKQLADASFPTLPTREVKKGDTWTRLTGLTLGPIGTFETKYTYTNDGPEKDANVEKISVKAETTYKAPIDRTPGFPFKINSADLKSAEGSGGTVRFRKDKGRPEKSELKLTLKGKLNVDVGGSASDVEVVNLTQTTTVTTTDENPLKKK